MGEGALSRAVRLAQLQHMLHRNPQGVNSRELASMLRVSQRTVQRDIQALQVMGVPLTEDSSRYGIMNSYLLPPVPLTLYETAAVYLAARLVYRGTDEDNPHVGEALTKLSRVLPHPLSMWVEQTQRSLGEKPPHPAFVATFERIALAWVTGRRLKLRYRSLKRQEPSIWLLEPYLMEVTGVGYSTYAFGMGKRFYQYKKEGDKYLTANYLIHEIPTGVNFWHFRHSTDKVNGLCPACCAIGLLRLSVFSTQGGQGKSPGINGKPSIYVLPVGETLAETLRLSWRVVSNLGTPA